MLPHFEAHYIRCLCSTLDSGQTVPNTRSHLRQGDKVATADRIAICVHAVLLRCCIDPCRVARRWCVERAEIGIPQQQCFKRHVLSAIWQATAPVSGKHKVRARQSGVGAGLRQHLHKDTTTSSIPTRDRSTRNNEGVASREVNHRPHNIALATMVGMTHLDRRCGSKDMPRERRAVSACDSRL